MPALRSHVGRRRTPRGAALAVPPSHGLTEPDSDGEMMWAFPLFYDPSATSFGLANADWSIAARYADLVADASLRARVFTVLTAEFGRTRGIVLGITRQAALLA
jgi:phosphoenolpyruvate carboxylase